MVERSGKILPQFNEQTFLRKAWIKLAQDDAPIEIFERGNVEASLEEKRIFFNSVAYEGSWTGEIGNDRQESYTDYENYTEEIPYTDYELKWDRDLKKNVRVPVTKYRKEQRQRAVTKTRTVTDWHSSSGSYSGSNSDFVCIDGALDRPLFTEEYDASYIKYLSEAEVTAEPDMAITKNMHGAIKQTHANAIDRDVDRALPGDHQRSVNYTVDSYRSTQSFLIKTPVYSATISYLGKEYAAHAFPFGKMKLNGDTVENDHGLRAKRASLKRLRDDAIANQEAEVEARKWKTIMPVAYTSVALLALSILISLFIRVLPLVIIGFGLAIAGLFYSKIKNKAAQEKAKEEAKSFASIKDREMNEAYDTFAKEYKEKLLTALNKKLTSLGYEPAKHIHE